MTELDRALEVLRDKPANPKAQSGFYDLFLNATFFVPTVTETVASDAEGTAQKGQLPLIVESEGNDYLVFFDQRQRLDDWAQTEAPCIELPGHVLAEMSTAQLFWAMNIGTDHVKQFAPDEIAWLKQVVERCKAEADENQPHDD